MKKVYQIAALILISITNIYSQDSLKNESDSLNLLLIRYFDGDTLPIINLKEIVIVPNYEKDLNWFQRRRHNRMIRNLKKVYPYAIEANRILEELSLEYQKIEGDNKKKKYIKEVEKRLRSKYEDELKKLSISQGRLLIKLIDRETGDTSYELVKELRGTISAVFWQALARLFGSNLKTEYDPLGEDRLIELYIKLIEEGKL